MERCESLIFSYFTQRIAAFHPEREGFMQDFENAGRFAPWPIQIFSAGTQTTGDLAAAIDDLGMGVWMCDPASDRFSPPEWLWRLAGIKPVIPTLSAFVAALHPDDRDHLVAAFDHAVAEGSTLQVEVRMDRPDQSARWVQLKGRAIAPKRGSLRILGVVSDVTAI
jgi:PAS domain-containing protein